MIFYFTGSGNSLWAAKELGSKLEQTVTSILKYEQEESVCAQDPVVGLVFPTYMGDLPWIVKRFLLKLKMEKGAYCFAVMTSSGGESGVAFQSIERALAAHEGRLCAGFDLQMPGNCLISSETENQARLSAAPEKLEKIAQELRKKTENYHSSGLRAEKGFVENSYFYGVRSLKRLTFMKHFTVSRSCDGCGRCAKICPVNNISIRNGKAVHGAGCAACYACMHWCPHHAVLPIAPMIRHRSQYRHPEVTLEEMIP